ncbi:retrovirus-related pol polyprotein from transposon TNT 1-94 [Tanacetum coccineum]
MVESLPTMVNTHINAQVKKQVPEQVRDQVPMYVAEGLILEIQKTKEEMERMIAKAILQERGNIQAEISSQIQKAIDNQIPSQVDASVRSYMSGHILHVHPTQTQTLFVPEQQYQLYLFMKDNPQLKQQDIEIWLALQMKFENLQVQQTTCRPFAVRPRDQDDPHDDAHPEGENSVKRQKTSEYEAYVSRESSSGQVNEEERDDDEIQTKQVSQDIMEEVSLTINEAKLKKMADEMLRQRCTSGDEHQYHIDQMKNFLQSDNVWESRKWVNKCVKKFNPYARYGVEHWKNPHAKIFYIRKQKEPGKLKEEVYSNLKIIQVIKTYWELGHEYKFVTKIVARRANECIVSITEPDYKNLNKNDIEDINLLIMDGKVLDYAETWLLWSLLVFIRSSVIWERVHEFHLGIEIYQQKVNLIVRTMSFPGVGKHRMFSIIYEPMHGIIYKNSKKEKKVMRHSEIYKFCDATLNRVLEGLKKEEIECIIESMNRMRSGDAKSTPTPRAWRLYLGKEPIKEGLGVGIILVSLEERMHSCAIRLKFNTSDHAIDCEALLAGLAVSVSKGMKDLHVFMDSPRLVGQTEGNYMPTTKQEKIYTKEIMDTTTLFHRFQITHLLKILNSKAEVLTGLATIKLEFLNQEVSVGIKTRPSVEETSSNKKGKATSNVPSAKPNYNWEMLVGAIKGTCNHNIYQIALCNPSEHDKVKFYWTNNNGVNTKHGSFGWLATSG